MTVRIRLNSIAVRIIFALTAAAFCIALVMASVSRFVAATLADDRAAPDPALLARVSDLFPGSGRLHQRVAESELAKAAPDSRLARDHARSALRICPKSYKSAELLAAAEEMDGDGDAAAETLTRALLVAPNDAGLRWRLANVLLRRGRLDEAAAQLKVASALDPSIFAAAMDVLWRASGGSVSLLERITGGAPDQRVSAAAFLLKHYQIDEACRVFTSASGSFVPNSKRLEFVNNLIEADAAAEARALWLGLIGVESAPPVWNRGFETDIKTFRCRFDWTLKQSDFVRLAIESGTGRGGGRALRLDFMSRDTPRLDDELSQLIVVRPGVNYELRFWAKTERFDAEGGPVITVAAAAKRVIGFSEPVSPGSADWRAYAFNFATPQSEGGRPAALVIGIKRQPRFAYEKPASGTIWLDDFELIER